ncbi:MAG: AAA family ATPase [Firmicutes bacterium]|nr:AAA family ATPase [Bacillota bacterium]
MGKILAITSGKGGSGKTTFAVNLGYTLAVQGKKVLLLDFNIGLRNIDIYLGVQDRVLFDFGDYLSGTCRLRKAIIKDENLPGLSLLSCPQIRDIKGLSQKHVSTLLGQLRDMYDVIIIDTPTGIGETFRNVVSCCDMALLVVTPNYSSIRNSDTVSKRIEALGIERFHVINRVSVQPAGSPLPGVEEIEKVLSLPLAGIISEDPNIDLGNNAGRPVVSARGSYIARNFEGIASRLSL